MDDIEDDLGDCNCSANRVDDLREILEEMELENKRNRNLVVLVNELIRRTRNLLS